MVFVSLELVCLWGVVCICFGVLFGLSCGFPWVWLVLSVFGLVDELG